jgi:hypothetical protein
MRASSNERKLVATRAKRHWRQLSSELSLRCRGRAKFIQLTAHFRQTICGHREILRDNLGSQFFEFLILVFPSGTAQYFMSTILMQNRQRCGLPNGRRALRKLLCFIDTVKRSPKDHARTFRSLAGSAGGGDIAWGSRRTSSCCSVVILSPSPGASARLQC